MQGGINVRVNGISSNNVGVQDSNRQEANRSVSSAYSVSEAMTSTIGNEKRPDVSADNSINDEMLENGIKQANKSLEQYNRTIERSIHEKTHTVMYVLKDTLTNEVITEFPSRKIQDMIAKMWEIAGLLVDERR